MKIHPVNSLHLIYMYIYMFHDKQAQDEKKRIYGYMVLTIIYMNTNFLDSVPVNEKKIL